MAERIEFESRSPFELHGILNALENAPPARVHADLHIPEGEGPFPCVIAIHGSKGWSPHHGDNVAHWVESGLAVCRVNSFESRGVDSVVARQMQVTHAMMLCDVFAAKDLLMSDARLSGRFALVGWSLGGTVSLYGGWQPVIDVLGPPFEAHIPYYPAAHIRPDVQVWSEAPKLILHGDADDWTPIGFVEDMLPQLPNAELVTYPGAHHGFDSVEPLHLLPEAIRLGKRTVRIDAGGRMSAIWILGIRIPLNHRWQRRIAFLLVRNIGAHAAGHAEARADSMARSTAFLHEHLA